MNTEEIAKIKAARQQPEPDMEEMKTKRRLTRREAAAYLSHRGFHVKPATLASWACSGAYSLPYYRLGKRIVAYDVADLDELIERHRIVWKHEW